MGNPALGLQLSKLLGTASSVVKGDIGQTAQLHTVALVQRESVKAGQASSILILALAPGVVDVADSIVQRITKEAGSACSSLIKGLAEGRHALAGPVDEHVVFTAGKTNLGIPVPVSASRISGPGVFG